MQVLLVFVAPSLLIMAHGAEVTESRTYQDVVSHLCGPLIGKLCQFLLIIIPFGANTAVLVLIGDQLIDSMLKFVWYILVYSNCAKVLNGLPIVDHRIKDFSSPLPTPILPKSLV